VRIPESLSDLIDQGIIDSVVRPLKSGKEALVYLVEINGGNCVAKVYKEPDHRTFRHRSAYTEGRKVRNTRDQRAMTKRTAYGQKKDDEAWRSAEVEAMYRLQAAGVRVPEPYHFEDDILLMELILDERGVPAPRLAEAAIRHDEALGVFKKLVQESVRMLSAGVVHGDLSEFNILMGAGGPVIIDFPQWVDASQNQNARKLLIRDLDNLTRFLRRFDPKLRRRPYGEEMWQAYERGELTPETKLTGKYVSPIGKIDLAGLSDEIRAAEEDYRQEQALKPKKQTPKQNRRRPGKNKKTPGANKQNPKTNKQDAKPNADGPTKSIRKRRRRRKKKRSPDGRNAPAMERPTRPGVTQSSRRS